MVGGDLSKTNTSEIVNEMTKELDLLLKTKEFKDLNPFLSPRKRIVPVPDRDGDIPISEIDGEGVNSTDSIVTIPGVDDPGHGDGTSFVEDPDGNEPGKKIERKSKGIRIIPTDEYPNEKEEAWVDLNRGAICINILHPFYTKMCNIDNSATFGKFEKFNITRLLIEALIKFKNSELKENWDPEKTLNTYRDLLHKTWKG